MNNNYTADALFKRRIEENIDLLENLELEKLYKEVRPSYAPMLTVMLQECGIDPLQHMTVVPDRYLCGQILKHFVLPSHIKKIGRESFKWCHFESFEFASNSECTEVSTSFVGASIATRTITFPESCNYIDAHCFENADIDRVVLESPTIIQFPEVFQDNDYPHFFVVKDSLTFDLLSQVVHVSKLHYIN